jgi:solute:Na+ symporter, SSS family
VFVVFYLGVFWKRMNWRGCLWSMVVGFALGIFRLAIDTPVALGLGGLANGYTEGSIFWIINKIYFQYFGVLITIASALTAVIVSLMSEEPNYKEIGGLTYGTATDSDHSETRKSWDWRDVAGSAFVLAAIVGAYLYFRG